MPLPRPAPGQGRWWVVGIVGVSLMTAVAVWLGLTNSRDAVIPTVTAYKVVSDAEVRVDFDVHRPAGAAVTCTVVTLDASFGTVGTLPVTIPAGPERDVHQQVVVRTAARAVAADVKRCDLATTTP